jgi:hypothetical protein
VLCGGSPCELLNDIIVAPHERIDHGQYIVNPRLRSIRHESFDPYRRHRRCRLHLLDAMRLSPRRKPLRDRCGYIAKANPDYAAFDAMDDRLKEHRRVQPRGLWSDTGDIFGEKRGMKIVRKIDSFARSPSIVEGLLNEFANTIGEGVLLVERLKVFITERVDSEELREAGTGEAQTLKTRIVGCGQGRLTRG